MRKIITLLALVATVSFASAQEQPKTAKTEVKKETCKKSGKCCKEKTASTATKTASVKK